MKRLWMLIVTACIIFTMMPLSTQASGNEGSVFVSTTEGFENGLLDQKSTMLSQLYDLQEPVSVGLVDATAALLSTPNDANVISEEKYIRFNNQEDMYSYLRKGFAEHSLYVDSDTTMHAYVMVPFSVASDPYEIMDNLREAVYMHTGDPKCGDYLRCNTLSDSYDISWDGEDWYIDITWIYRMTHDQDAAVDAAVEQLLTELNLEEKSDYEKIRTIYDWMCTNISYDHSLSNYDTYSAICGKNVVCQGYASLFYRLCLELGLDCRVCTGYAPEGLGGYSVEKHGWNVVLVDGQYYYVDTTWGTVPDNEPDYYYLLKGRNGMLDHMAGRAAWNENIEDYCTVALEDYPIPEAKEIVAAGMHGEHITWTLSKTGKMTLSGSGVVSSSFFNEIWDVAGSVKSLIIGEGITVWDAGSAGGLDRLTEISLPDSLVSIGEYGFYGTNLISVEIPANLRDIGVFAFYCSYLNEISVDSANAYYCTVDGVMFSKDKKTLVQYAGIVDYEAEDGMIASYSVPEGTEIIGQSAFGGNKILKEIILPETVTVIGDYAFDRCGNAEINFPESLVSIGKGAFTNCLAISDIYLGRNVAHIGTGAFADNTYIETINVHPENAYYTAIDNVLFSKDMTVLIQYPAADTRTKYVIPEGVVEIEESAFEGFQNVAIDHAHLTEVVFPNSLTAIGKCAFEGQENLTNFVLPPNLETIGDCAFQGVKGMDRIVIPDSVKSIGFSAFNNHAAETIIIGKGIEYIGDRAFTQIGYAKDNGNAEIKVYFRGNPPKILKGMGFAILFGYDPEGYNSTRVYATVYYPEAYADQWAPNGEDTWTAVTVDYYDVGTYNIFPYSGEIHNYVSSFTPANCIHDGGITYTCTYCQDSYEEITEYATGQHTYSGGQDTICDDCGWVRPVDAVYPDNPQTVHMFRLYDPNSGEHFYTGSTEERDFLVSVGWNYEGVGFSFPVAGAPVYRLYDPVCGEHLYTMNIDEVNSLVVAGWNNEGIAFNTAPETEVPQYRLHNPNETRGAYHFTSSTEERDNLLAVGWEYQSIGWYSCWK